MNAREIPTAIQNGETTAKEVLEKDQQMEWNLLDNPKRLKVQTIDSLCASIVGKMPILSKFGIITKSFYSIALKTHYHHSVKLRLSSFLYTKPIVN